MTTTPLLGIEIGGTKLQVVLGEESGRIVERRKLPVEVERGSAGIREQIAQEIAAIRASTRIGAVGVGFGGPVNSQTGRIARSHQIEGWSDFNLRGWLTDLAGARVCVENDANTAALGEALHGAGKNFTSVFYVTMGSGVGGGLVVNGSIYHGAAPGEAEIGHLRVSRAGTILESVCSGWAVDRKIAAMPESEQTGVLRMLTHGMQRGQARHLKTALEARDPAAARILRETADTLAFGLSHVTHLFHPEIIVLGGGLSGVGEPLREAVQATLPSLIMDVFKPGPVITLSELREDAVPAGALELAARQTRR